MNKAYVFAIGVIIALTAAGFFMMRANTSREFSVSNVPVPEKDPLAESQIEPIADTPQETVVPEMQFEKDQQNDAPLIQDTHLDTGTNTISKDIDTKSASISEASKESTQKKTTATSKFDVESRLVDFGFSIPSKPRAIDTIILHSSYDAIGDDPYSVAGVIAEWKDFGVAPHYLIDRKGVVYRLVKDENVAYHAGVSKVPDGRTNVNDFSIGVEILNTKTGDYTEAQYVAVKQLIAFLKETYAIKYVLGHDDIAPGRKSDPWNFDWKKL